MKTNNKNISNSNKTLARLLSLFYGLLAVLVLSGTLVLNSSNTSRPFWLSADDSMNTLTFLVFITVVFLSVLTKSIFLPLGSIKKVKELDERQKSLRSSVFAISFGVVISVGTIFMLFLREQIEADAAFIQSRGELVLPIFAIYMLMIGLPSAIASWRKNI